MSMLNEISERLKSGAIEIFWKFEAILFLQPFFFFFSFFWGGGDCTC